MRGLQEIRALRLMTSSANLNLRGCSLHRILGRMQRVTTCTRYVARRVCTRCVSLGRVRLVTGQTSRILPWCRRQRFGPEVDHARQRAASRLHVRAARPVTGFALQAAVTEWTMRIVRSRVRGAEQTRDAGIVVTAETSVRALGAVGRYNLCARSRGRGRGRTRGCWRARRGGRKSW